MALTAKHGADGKVIFLVEADGSKIPEQMKVMSLTGHRVGRMLETTMTSIEMPAFQMGEATARLAIEQIEADPKHKPANRHINFAQNLVEREST